MVWYLDTGKIAPRTDSKKKEENIALNIPHSLSSISL